MGRQPTEHAPCIACRFQIACVGTMEQGRATLHSLRPQITRAVVHSTYRYCQQQLVYLASLPTTIKKKVRTFCIFEIRGGISTNPEGMPRMTFRFLVITFRGEGTQHARSSRAVQATQYQLKKKACAFPPLTSTKVDLPAPSSWHQHRRQRVSQRIATNAMLACGGAKSDASRPLSSGFSVFATWCGSGIH